MDLEQLNAAVSPLAMADAAERSSLAKKLWGVECNLGLPEHLVDGVRVRQIDWCEASAFVSTHWAEFFPGTKRSQFSLSGEPEVKARWYALTADILGLFSGADCIGVFLGHPIDWGTYYIRWMSILPEFQGRGLWTTFLDQLSASLRNAAVERLETDVTHTNTGNLRAMMRNGFVVTGNKNSERWGALVTLTKFLSSAHEQSYIDRFCFGIAHKG